jgi:magnesium transporter
MIKIYHRAVKNKFTELKDFKVGAWVDVSNPTEDEIKKVIEMLGINESLLHDALDPYEVPRLEADGDVTYVFTRAPQVNKKEIITVPFLVAIGKDFVLTFSRSECNFLNDIRSGKKLVHTTQKTKFFMQVFSSLNLSYSGVLLSVNKQVRAIKVRLEKINNKDIVRFVDFEYILNDFLSALLPTNAVLQKLLDGKHIPLYEEDKDLVEDIFLSNGQLIETVRSTLRYVVNIRDAYSNIMTHDLNRVMKILTALTIILTIPTMIFSFYGMNVNLPDFSYFGISIFTLVVSAFVFLIFLKKRWF